MENDSNSTDDAVFNNLKIGLAGLYPNMEAVPSVWTVLGLNYVYHV